MSDDADVLRIDLIITDPNFTRTGIVWQGTLGQLMTEAEAKRLNVPVEQLDISFIGDGDPDQLVIIRRIFPDKEESND